jgi:uncharacterized protein YyaL (SSP411 family)
LNINIEDITTALIKNHQSTDSQGFDPYDGLNSSFLKFFTFGSSKLRLYAQQFIKRSIFNYRPVLGIKKERNPKGIGLLVRAYILAQNEEYHNTIRELLDWLDVNANNKYHGKCWGYNFDWQSAVFYIPKGEPTVVNTSFIANAFLDAYDVFKAQKYLDIARSACDFILKYLYRTERGEGFCFSYSPFDKSVTHNANLLAAELLTRVYQYTKEPELLKIAGKAIDFTLAHFNGNGSIYQGTAPEQHFIDSFHTGFVLVSLWNIAKYSDLEEKNPIYMRTMYNAYKYYKQTFFEEDGLPHYYYKKKYPIDLHCTSQGIITYLTFKDYDHEAIGLAQTIAKWAIDNMWDEKKGYFYYQKTRFFTNKINYLRWPNIWMFYALTMLMNHGIESI